MAIAGVLDPEESGQTADMPQTADAVAEALAAMRRLLFNGSGGSASASATAGGYSEPSPVAPQPAYVPPAPAASVMGFGESTNFQPLDGPEMASATATATAFEPGESTNFQPLDAGTQEEQLAGGTAFGQEDVPQRGGGRFSTEVGSEMPLDWVGTGPFQKARQAQESGEVGFNQLRYDTTRGLYKDRFSRQVYNEPPGSLAGSGRWEPDTGQQNLPFGPPESLSQFTTSPEQQRETEAGKLAKVGLNPNILNLPKSINIQDKGGTIAHYAGEKDAVSQETSQYGFEALYHEALHSLETKMTPEERNQLRSLIADFPPPANLYSQHHPNSTTAYFDTILLGGENYEVPPAVRDFVNRVMARLEQENPSFSQGTAAAANAAVPQPSNAGDAIASASADPIADQKAQPGGRWNPAQGTQSALGAGIRGLAEGPVGQAIGAAYEGARDTPLLGFNAPVGGRGFTRNADASTITAGEAYSADVPYYSDFARGQIKPFVEENTPLGLGGVASSLVPVSLGDVALTLAPGVGDIWDVAALARAGLRLTKAGGRNVLHGSQAAIDAYMRGAAEGAPGITAAVDVAGMGPKLTPPEPISAGMAAKGGIPHTDLPTSPSVVPAPEEAMHGTGLRFETFEEGFLDQTGLFGPGVYLTDAEDIASSYARTRAKKLGEAGEALVQDVSVKPGTRLINLEVPLPDEAAQAILDAAARADAESWYDVEAWDMAAKAIRRGDPGKGVYSAFKEGLEGDGFTTVGDAGEALDALNQNLKQAGFGGVTHVGGIRGGAKHTVSIIFDPADIQKISPRAAGALPSPQTPRAAPSAGAVDPALADWEYTLKRLEKSADPVAEKARLEAISRERQAGKQAAGEQSAQARFSNTGKRAADETRRQMEEARTNISEPPSLGAGLPWMNRGDPAEQAKRALDDEAGFPGIKQDIKLTDELVTLAGLPRQLKATLDLSAPGRQGLALALRHPKEWFEAWVPMIKAGASEEGMLAVNRRINDMLVPFSKTPALPGQTSSVLPKDMPIHFYEVGPNAPGLERVPGFEAAGAGKLSEAVRKIPGIKQSERAYATFLNYQKAKTFYTMAKADPTGNHAGLGRIIDHATGYGEAPLHGRIEGQALFSQRYFMSRFQFLADPLVEALKHHDMAAARAATENLVAFAGGMASIMYLGDQTGVWEAEFDPRHSDFGKIRVGPQRIDFGAGFLPLIRAAARITTGTSENLTSGKYDTNEIKEGLSFLRNKLAPLPSELISRIVGENPAGQPNPDLLSLENMRNLFMPLIADATWEAVAEGGPKAGARAFLSELVGGGTSTYGSAQVRQQEAAREQFGNDYGNLHAIEQAQINAQAAKAGDLPWRDREDAWWTARSDALQTWKEDLGDEANDPLIQQALKVDPRKEGDEFKKELTDWLRSQGETRHDAETAVDKMLRATKLDDYVESYRKDVIENDPEFLAAWIEAFENDEAKYYPSKWALEFLDEILKKQAGR